jgi:hypothetical protein
LRLLNSDFNSYYHEMKIIGDHATLRQLWISEGKRRGYALEDYGS